MGFLERNWEHIQPIISEGTNPLCEAEGYILPWNHDRANMEMICNAIFLLRPTRVVETGTFEGLGTEYMARTMMRYAHVRPSEIWTFDAGLPYFSTAGGPNCIIDPSGDERFESWGKVINARNRRIMINYPGVSVRYVEGLTKNTLPDALEEMGHWDFCFQDSMHDLEGIKEEWLLLEPYGSVDAVIVFDDVLEGHPFIEWFRENAKGWRYRHTTIGRQQLWAERMENE